MSGVGVAMSNIGKMDYKEELKKLIDEIDDPAVLEDIGWSNYDTLSGHVLYIRDLAMRLKQKISLEEMYE